MKEFNYTITDPQGIHARPAGVLVKEAAKYQSTITLEKDGKTGDAKRIFAVMGLAAKCGNTLNVKGKSVILKMVLRKQHHFFCLYVKFF